VPSAQALLLFRQGNECNYCAFYQDHRFAERKKEFLVEVLLKELSFLLSHESRRCFRLLCSSACDMRA
jgi:hypothetical protein